MKIPPIAGIYQLRNKINGKVYVGQSHVLIKRKKRHFSDLRGNTHCNRYLQRAFNQYGESNFEFAVLEEVTDLSQLTQREQYWLNLKKASDPNYGYNIGICAEASQRGIKRSDEFKNKLRVCNLGKHLSKEHKRSIGLAGIGRKHTEEAKQKMRGHVPWNKGKHLSDEIKQHMRGHTPWNKGKPSIPGKGHTGKLHTVATKLKMRLAKLGKPSHRKGKHHTEAAKLKMRLAHTGKKFSEETKQRMRLAHRAHFKELLYANT